MEDITLQLLGMPDSPTAIKSDSSNEGSELSLLALALPLPGLLRLSPFNSGLDLCSRQVVYVAVIWVAIAKHPRLGTV